jgi:Fe-Mn family superoxide dismutase
MSRKLSIDLEKIIESSLEKSRLRTVVTTKESPVSVSGESEKEEDVVQEAYVAEPKKYTQSTEFMTQKVKDAHTELYKNYVESLNRVSAELDTVPTNESNPRHSNWKSLKEDETYNVNAVWLHELFFANAFDVKSEVYVDSMAFMRLERDFGSFEHWQKCFISCALAAGNGWVVTGYNMFLKRYVTTFVDGHSDSVMLGLYPVIVIDMWEHAYSKDYLDDKRNYLISRMREIDWNVVEERVNKAERIAEVLK